MTGQYSDSNRRPLESHAGEPIQHQQGDLDMLLLSYEQRPERRRSTRWSVDWNLEGWLQLDDAEDQAIPLILVDFGPGGVGAVLQASHPLRPGQQGQLILQAHGGGCHCRPVRCQSVRTHPVAEDLRCAGFAFES